VKAAMLFTCFYFRSSPCWSSQFFPLLNVKMLKTDLYSAIKSEDSEALISALFSMCGQC